VRAAVDLQDVVVEILDAQAEARDSQVFDDLEFAFGERSGLALEGDLLGFIPRQQRFMRSTRLESCREEM
jgi:hypothetical protein